MRNYNLKKKKKMINKKKNIYYLTLFKIEGHEQWRANLKTDPDAFQKEVEAQKNHPKITEQKVIVISRMTGEVITEDEAHGSEK